MLKLTPQIRLALDKDTPVALYRRRLEKQTLDGDVYCRRANTNNPFVLEQHVDSKLYEADFLIVKLRIGNKRHSENSIYNVTVSVEYPSGLKVELVRTQERQMGFNNEYLVFRGHDLLKDLSYCINDYISSYMRLEGDRDYLRILPIKLVDFPENISSSQINIRMEDKYNCRSNISINFGIKDGKAFLISTSKLWRRVEFTEKSVNLVP